MLTKDKAVQAQFKTQYDNDDLKRVVFIFPTANYKEFEAHISAELEAVNTQITERSGGMLSIHKAFFFKEYDDVFE